MGEHDPIPGILPEREFFIYVISDENFETGTEGKEK